MKAVVFRGKHIEKLYGAKYTDEFFNQLWQDNLETIEEIDEVVYEEHDDQSKSFVEKIKDADIVLGMAFHDGLVCEELFKQCPKVKYMSTGAHGFGKFDYEATKAHGVTLTNTIYGDSTIAQFAMGLLLDICHNISAHSDYYKKDKWTSGIKGKHIITPQIELCDKTMGLYGLGNIGFKVAQMAQGFGMKVIAYSRTKKTEAKYDFIEQVSFDEMLERSDVISIHCPLTDDTRSTINAESIAKMKDDVILINTARGDIVDEDALYDALQSKKIMAAGLDVVCGEPLSKPCKLMECENTKITDHMAWITIDSRIRSTRIACENLKNWIAGTPTSVINK